MTYLHIQIGVRFIDATEKKKRLSLVTNLAHKNAKEVPAFYN